MKKIAQCAITAVLLVTPVRKFAAADTPAVTAVPRFALLIGDGKYAEVALKNAPIDAKALADRLTSIGFDVTQ